MVDSTANHDQPSGEQALTERISELKTRLRAAENRITELENEGSNYQLPQLGYWSGDLADYKVWAEAARQKLALDGAPLSTPRLQCTYLYFCMTMKAQKLVLHQYQRMKAESKTGADWWDHMDSMFIDPNAKRNAFHRLRGLTQRDNEPIIEVLARFQQLLSEAEIGGDRVRIMLLEQGLNRANMYALVGHTYPEDYNGYVSRLLQVMR